MKGLFQTLNKVESLVNEGKKKVTIVFYGNLNLESTYMEISLKV